VYAATKERRRAPKSGFARWVAARALRAVVQLVRAFAVPVSSAVVCARVCTSEQTPALVPLN